MAFWTFICCLFCFAVGVIVGCRAGGLGWLKSLWTALLGWVSVVAKEIRVLLLALYDKLSKLFGL